MDNIVKCQHKGDTNPHSDKFIQLVTQSQWTGGDRDNSPSRRMQQSPSTFILGVELV
jgi:hypothetical protein